MANFIRALFGAPQVHRTEGVASERGRDDDDEQSAATAIHALPTTSGYFGRPVPLEASLDPEDSQAFYCDFYDEYLAVIANDKERILLFPSTLHAIDGKTGQPQYDTGRDDDGETPQDRLEGAARIYEHLRGTGSSWPQTLVQFASRTTSGFSLERLSPGPLPWHLPKVGESDAILALYQRWALQLLSALDFLHQHNIVLNALEHSSLWLRDDLSIAIANMVNAGSLDCGVSAGQLRSSAVIESPWSPIQLYHTKNDDETYPGDVRGDLFDWATFVFALFSGGKTPLDFDLDPSHDSQEWLQRQNLVAAGGDYQWPHLADHLLGPVLTRAWKNQYASTADALRDVTTALTEAGRELSQGPQTDLLNVAWQDCLEVVSDSGGRTTELRVKRT